MARKMPKTVTQPQSNANTLVMFGTDEHAKPRAARFTSASVTVVTKAAQAMQLKFAEVTTEAQAEVAQKLPTGRLYSTGKGFVPPVRRELFAKLLAAFGIEAVGDTPRAASADHVYPASYDEIAPGHLVLVQESLKYGWWEAIVLERNAENVTVKWRDYPKAPPFTRHFDAVALIRPPAPISQPAVESKAADQ